jgi:V/A-type H+-transporting ATPase subunit I
MEGMVAMIQGVRLQYYELFSKYFAGDGVAYRPFELRQVETSPTSKPGEPES